MSEFIDLLKKNAEKDNSDPIEVGKRLRDTALNASVAMIKLADTLNAIIVQLEKEPKHE